MEEKKVDYPQLFDALPDSVEAALRASIEKFGVLVPIVRDQHGGMIDGRHRARIADELGVSYRVDVVQVIGAEEAREIQRTLNADRRHLSGEQLREHIVFLAQQVDEDGVGVYSQPTIAQVTGVSQPYVNQTLGDDQLISTYKLPDRRLGADGKVRPARRPPTLIPASSEAQAARASEVLNKLYNRSWAQNPTATEVIREGRQAAKAERVAAIAAAPVSAIGEDETFPVVLADPPWRYDYAEDTSRQIENHYPTMTIDEMAELYVPSAEDCVLFCWATSPKLRDAFVLLDAWDFIYKTCMVWVKDKIGMGYYARQQHELLLIATKGNLPVPEPADRPSSVFHGERTAHSAKPPIAHELIEAMYPHYRRCEMFARQPREGWKVWGNQAGGAA
jgi:N6-adenosine-specific RNA methylase IME4